MPTMSVKSTTNGGADKNSKIPQPKTRISHAHKTSREIPTAALLLPLLSIFGAYKFIFSPMSASITIHITSLFSSGRFSFSSSQGDSLGDLLQSRFTPFPLFDLILNYFTSFFHPLISWINPPATLFTLYFLSQLLPVFIIIAQLESSRHQTPAVLRYPAVWNMILVQLTGFATGAPAWYFCSLIKPATGPVDSAAMGAVLPAVILGYGTVTAMMFLPGLEATHKQWWCAVWQFWPLYIAAIQWILVSLGIGNWIAKRGLGVKQVWKILTAVGGLGHWGMMWRAGIQEGIFWMPECQAEAVVSLEGATRLLIWWDFWIGAVASGVWAWTRLGSMKEGTSRGAMEQFGTAMILGVGLVAIGPMAVMAGLELWREGIEEERKRKDAK
ncbi:hypothetical protein BZA77DRAFT_369549 [Pyronema omphalodes]|nr:hypothetical protein BZA77DRAFT_369549 [Pyronema omphalodes]